MPNGRCKLRWPALFLIVLASTAITAASGGTRSRSSIVAIDFGGNEYAAGVAIQRDSKVVATGTAPNREDPSTTDVVLVRVLASGRLDPAFSRDGWVRTDVLGGTDFGHDVAIQRDGRILVAATAMDTSADQWSHVAVLRYRSNGTLDRSFGEEGVRIVRFDNEFGQSYDTAAALAVQRDGRILVAGDSRQPGPNAAQEDDAAIARLTPNGSPDATFAGDGTRAVDLGTGDEGFSAVTVSKRGIVAAGRSYDGSVVVRLQGNGQLDPSFSQDGLVTTRWSSGPGLCQITFAADQAADVAVMRDGRVVTAGWSPQCTGNDFAVARYREGGALDKSFSRDGRQVLDFPPGPRGPTDAWYYAQGDKAYALQLERDGGILLGGFAGESPGSDVDFALARLTARGRPDRTFSGDGMRMIDAGSELDYAGDMARRDGKVALAGEVERGAGRFQDVGIAITRAP